MHEGSLKSKAARAILAVLLLFPKRAFSAQEIAATTKAPLRQAAEALRALSRSDIAIVAAKRGKRYWRLNPYHPQLPELREFAFDPRPRYADLVAQQLRRIPEARLIVLSGIFTGEMDLSADLLVVGDAVSRSRLLPVVAALGGLVGAEINFALFTRAEYDERRYLNDRLIRDILDHKHVVVFNTLRRN